MESAQIFMSQYVISTISFCLPNNHFLWLESLQNSWLHGIWFRSLSSNQVFPRNSNTSGKLPGKHWIAFYWQGKPLDHQPPFNPPAIILWILLVSQREDAKTCWSYHLIWEELSLYPFGRVCIVRKFLSEPVSSLSSLWPLLVLRSSGCTV